MAAERIKALDATIARFRQEQEKLHEQQRRTGQDREVLIARLGQLQTSREQRDADLELRRAALREMESELEARRLEAQALNEKQLGLVREVGRPAIGTGPDRDACGEPPRTDRTGCAGDRRLSGREPGAWTARSRGPPSRTAGCGGCSPKPKCVSTTRRSRRRTSGPPWNRFSSGSWRCAEASTAAAAGSTSSRDSSSPGRGSRKGCDTSPRPLPGPRSDTSPPPTRSMPTIGSVWPSKPRSATSLRCSWRSHEAKPNAVWRFCGRTKRERPRSWPWTGCR